MREILFRAKRIDNSEWVEGYYCKWKQIRRNLGSVKEKVVDCIITWMSDGGMSRYEIDSETLCQFTGSNDKNGNRIWENDIVKHDISDTIGTVRWYQEDYAGWCVDDVVIDEQQFTDEMWSECEIVGNIFDNPELLKGE